jgi:hypothetical protein
LRGITPTKFLSTYYDVARRYLGISPATVDQYTGLHATARIEENTVTLTAPDGRQHVGTFRSMHRGKVGRWVNKFNERAAG